MRLEKYWDNIIDFFGLSEEPGDKEKNHFKAKSGYEVDQKEKVVSINRKREFKLIFHHPDSYDEVKNIVDDLKDRNAIILNLENTDVDIARRFIDFISGAVYGLNGNVQKIGSGVFVFTPSNIEVDGKKIEDIIKNDFISRG